MRKPFDTMVLHWAASPIDGLTMPTEWKRHTIDLDFIKDSFESIDEKDCTDVVFKDGLQLTIKIQYDTFRTILHKPFFFCNQ